MLPDSEPIVYYVAQLYSNGLSDYKLGTISIITYPHLHPREKTTDIFRLCASNLVAGAASQHDIQHTTRPISGSIFFVLSHLRVLAMP